MGKLENLFSYLYTIKLVSYKILIHIQVEFKRLQLT